MENWLDALQLLMDQLLLHHPLSMAYPDWSGRLCNDAICVLREQGLPPELEDELEVEGAQIAAVLSCCRLPPRCTGDTVVLGTEDINRYRRQVETLAKTPQPAQRTPEWYKFRHQHITASSAWKLIAGGRSADAFIYDKCQPLKSPDPTEPASVPSTETPMHWGVRFEPVSVELYERMFNTQVSDFGCIPHPVHSFLAASPDGIVTKDSCPRLGRMLEIKNIVNREINGIPKMEYWTQMQLQMEVCDLDECDFLETRFKEYPSHGAFVEDGSYTHTRRGMEKGIMMFFLDGVTPVYEYCPIGICESDARAWEEEEMARHQERGHLWVRNIYWYLDQVSCVLVERDRDWFASALPVLGEAWRTILRERIEGCAHRAPKRKAREASAPPPKQMKCHIDVAALFADQGEVVLS